MSAFNVWAPLEHIESLGVVIDGTEHRLNKNTDGFWSGSVPAAGPGTRYQFRINGDPNQTYPDPRSHFQPEGVHGPSQIVDHGAFKWTDKEWSGRKLSDGMRTGVVYEMHIGTFSQAGTFDGAAAQLDHVRDTGATHIELMPPSEFPGKHGWGYDSAEIYAPHHAYGGPDGMKRFIDKAHSIGLAVIVDVQYNHAGPAGNYLGKFGPYFGRKTEWGDGIDLSKEPVVDYYLKNAEMMLKHYHADGLRLDAVHAYDPYHRVEMVQRLNSLACDIGKETGVPRCVIAETDFDPNLVREAHRGGCGLDAEWNSELSNAVYSMLMHGNKPGYYNNYNGGQDVVRALSDIYIHNGREHVGDLSGHRFVQATATHDTVGNTPDGYRMHHKVGPERAMIAFGIVAASPQVPMIFQGDEYGEKNPWAFFSNHDPELGQKVTQGRPNEFRHMGWKPEDFVDPQAPSTFSNSKLDLQQKTAGYHADMQHFSQEALRLRENVSCMSDGNLNSTVNPWFDPATNRLSFQRGPGVQVVVNTSADAREFYLEQGADPGVILSSKPGTSKNGRTLTIPSDSIAFVVQQGAIDNHLPYQVRSRPAEALLGRPLEAPGSVPAPTLALDILRGQNGLPAAKAPQLDSAS